MYGIYWDCDGTLMDTEKAFAYAWQEILKSKNLDLPIEHFDQYVGVDDKIVHKKYSYLAVIFFFKSINFFKRNYVFKPQNKN